MHLLTEVSLFLARSALTPCQDAEDAESYSLTFGLSGSTPVRL
jgi:hypothetical protein